ncbi:MAG: molybdopterin cofactor-binding domain-containing protein [Roseiarcus sp.]
MNAIVSRRSFIAASLSAAGGLIVAVASPRVGAAAPLGPEPWGPERLSTPNEVNAFVVVEPDGTILLRIAKSEMGQGVMTSLAMIIAEELECDFAKVKVEYASATRNFRDAGVYGPMQTGGSSSVRRSRVLLQQAGTSARARLIAAAAARWGVAPEACVARGGAVWHEASARSAPYGALAGEAAGVGLRQEPAIKTPEQFKLIGTSQARLDTPAKVTGAARFGIDTRLPGMVYAAVANCPVFGGKAKSYDEAAIKGKRGFIAVVPVENGVAVVADRFWRAKEMVAALPIVWDEGVAATTDSEQFRAEYRAALDGALVNAARRGDPAGTLAASPKIVEALYEVPHLAHAPMEPLNATVDWRPDRIDAWIGTQAPDAAHKLASEVGGVDPRNVFIHNCYLGGGFGRRAVNDELRQAVQVSRALGKPVKLVWTREQDMQHDRYRPQAALRLKAGLGVDGAPTAFDFRTAVGSITRSLGWGKVSSGVEPSAVEGLVNVPYRAGALNVACALKNTHVPVMFWRSVGSSQNAFAVESFVDELAHAAGEDPFDYRRMLLADRPDFLAVLDKLGEKGEWGKPLPARTARGLAIHESFGTIVGEIAQVAVSKGGEVKVERVTACIDCGHVVNPLNVEMQIESAVLYGLTAALFGEITIKNGAVEQGNFDDYQIARMADAPVVETHFALSGGGKWGGVGEPGTPPIAPAVANAIFAITGKRIRSLPLKNVGLGV